MTTKTLAIALASTLVLLLVHAQDLPVAIHAKASPSPNTSKAATTAKTTATATATATAKSAECFPGDAIVTLDSGRHTTLADLRVGDRVAVGSGEFSNVFLFTHAERSGRFRFVRITTASGAVLRATHGHYVPVGAAGDLKAAGAVVIGDIVHLADGSTSPVVAVGAVWATGLYNAQTAHGDIVVDGIRASTYTTAVHPRFAHAALAPLRTVFDYAGMAASWCNAAASAVEGVAAPRGASSVA